MMDRAKKDKLPQMQVGFIDGVCLPIYEVEFHKASVDLGQFSFSFISNHVRLLSTCQFEK